MILMMQQKMRYLELNGWMKLDSYLAISNHLDLKNHSVKLARVECKILLRLWRNFFSQIGTMLILSLEVIYHYINNTIANPNDFIEIKFDLTTIDTLQGLHAYMNTLLYNNEEIMRFCLRKISHFWGFKENNFIYYMLAPPWVRVVVVIYYILIFE